MAAPSSRMPTAPPPPRARSARRPLPALAFLLALTVLTAIVWWRVLHRDNAGSTPVHSTTTSQAPTCTPKGKAVTLPKPRAVTVTVLNGAGRDHLAATVQSALQARGFATPVQPSDAPSNITGVAQIQYGPAGKAGATVLSFYLPGSKLTQISRADASVTLVLGPSYSTLASNAAVAAAQARFAKVC